MIRAGKIVNDPVYGFIKFPEPEILRLINHPWFQRLRGIKQMGMAQLVYPGAVHTRFHHSLGAAHLMYVALSELKNKGTPITQEEELSARQAILLHDIGHGPFSHALEFTLAAGIQHEQLSATIIRHINKELDGELDTAIAIFENKYPKFFLHQLVSSQLDMDRMDYLSRDSFYTGVSEGVIGYDRILQMLTVANDKLAIEEKGIYSIEKFLIARRLMYWQVYLHKAVIGAENLIINILKRAKEISTQGQTLFATPALQFFLKNKIERKDLESNSKVLSKFCALDDADIFSAIKVWTNERDKTLADLSKMLVERNLYKVKISSKPLEQEYEQLKINYLEKGGKEEFADYFVIKGEANNNAYNKQDDNILIAMKDGRVLPLSEVDYTLFSQEFSAQVKKFYVCYHHQ